MVDQLPPMEVTTTAPESEAPGDGVGLPGGLSGDRPVTPIPAGNIAPSHQGLRRHAYCDIRINGESVTDRLDPHLISVQVILKSSGVNTCSIELDDRDGQLPIPPQPAQLSVYLGWSSVGPRIPPVPTPMPAGSELELPFGGGAGTLVFYGTIQQIESGFARRGGGRRLWVEAHSADMTSKIKSGNLMTMGVGETPEGESGGEEVSLKDFMEKAAKAAGITINMDEKFAGIKRKFFMQNESFMQLGQRFAADLGGIFRIDGKTASLVDALSHRNVHGVAMPAIAVWWGVNLISWRIKPFAARPQFKGMQSHWFNTLKGVFETNTANFGGNSNSPFNLASAIGRLPASAPNRQVGDQVGEGFNTDSQRERGTGWVMFNGEPEAQPQGILTIVGARPGVDGTYTIEEAEHNWSRRGYFTRCDLKNPGAHLGATPSGLPGEEVAT